MPSQELVTEQKRSSYPQKKVDMLEQVARLAKQYDTIIVSKLHKVRAGQLMLLRKNLRGQLVMMVAKNKIASLGLQKAGISNPEPFIQNLSGQNALIFTSMNPFKLYLSLEKSKINLPARAGDIATDDIVIPAGNTGIAPGPVLSEFKEAGVQTRIEAGSIYVTRDSVVAHPQDVISPKLAGLLSRLNIKPIKAGLSIFMASTQGLILLQKDISIDLEQYRSDVALAAAQALSLAVEGEYVTPEALPTMVVKAFREAQRVGMESGFISGDNASSVLGFAENAAASLLELAKKKGYNN
jgi:large subunit ribosomal protein L10